jgi:hypothetical protein
MNQNTNGHVILEETLPNCLATMEPSIDVEECVGNIELISLDMEIVSYNEALDCFNALDYQTMIQPEIFKMDGSFIQRTCICASEEFGIDFTVVLFYDKEDQELIAWCGTCD